MVNFIKTQNSFANGEVSPIFFTHDNIHGLGRMENLDVIPGGGFRRRAGLKSIAKLPSNARLVPFSLDEGADYVLAITDGFMRIFSNDTFIQDVNTPWTNNDLPLLQYAQRFGTIIFVHPDYKPCVLQLQNGTFNLVDFAFSSSDDTLNINMPFTRFDDSNGITITVSNSNGATHFITNSDFWTLQNVNGYIYIGGKTWIITSYIGPQDVTAICNGQYTVPQSPISNWQEAVFSPRRGWPSSITFHQDRLVFAGAKSWPGGVWMSHVGDHGNFSPGTGLDDQAIYFTLLSDKRQHICTIASRDNLQILTSDAEWAVSNKPLTPESVDIKKHTSVGSPATRHIQPQDIEGKTVFVAQNMREIRELTLDELGNSYNANNLCALAEHMVQNPIDMAYNKITKQLFVVMADGNMAVLNYNPALGISAWGRYTTSGSFCAVAICGAQTFVITMRDNLYYLERFDAQECIDAGTYQYNICARAMPPMSNGHNAHHIRITKVTVRLLQTKTLFINAQRAPLPNEVYETPDATFSGDISMNFLGTCGEFDDAIWEISSSDALPITVLSVTAYGRYQI